MAKHKDKAHDTPAMTRYRAQQISLPDVCIKAPSTAAHPILTTAHLLSYNRYSNSPIESGTSRLARDISRDKVSRPHSLHLTDNLARPGQRLDHLLTLFPPPDCEVAFFQELLKLVGAVHILEKLTLHFVFRMPVNLLH